MSRSLRMLGGGRRLAKSLSKAFSILFFKVVEGHISVSIDEDSGQSYIHAVILLRYASVPPCDRPDKQ
jgi:hypothetical protein